METKRGFWQVWLAFLQPAIKHLLVLGLFGAVTVFVAYQSRLPMKIAVGGDNQQYTAGFSYIQGDQEHSYRWTNGNGVVKFPSVGKATPLLLSIVAYAWRDETRVFTATVTVNGYPVGSIDRAGWRTWRFQVLDPTLLDTDELVIGVHSTPFVFNELSPDFGDERKLGVAVDSVEIQPQWGQIASLERWTDLVVIPSVYQFFFVVLFVPLAYLFARYLGLNEKHAFYLGIIVIVLFGVGIAFFRFQASQRVLILTLAIGVVAFVKIARDWNLPTLPREGMARVCRPTSHQVAAFVIPASVMLVAFLLRMHALAVFPVEGDDGLYTEVAERYAQALRSADWGQVIALNGVIEHPRLYVLFFAVSVVIRDFVHVPLSDVVTMRLVAVIFGALQTGLVAILNPLAGWFLAIQTTEIKFTSMAYLEALPALTATLSILLFERFRRTSQNAWLYLSALALGATGASKFIYVIAGFAILPFLLWEQRHQPQRIIGYGLLAAFAFFAFDPYLWYDPVGRLHEMFFFHASFSTRDYVRELSRPWWYNLVVLAESAKIYLQPFEYPPPFLMVWDAPIYALGLLGLPALVRRSRLYLAWFLVGVAFISLWEAKWEQYAMVIATPLCLSAGYGVADLLAWVSRRFTKEG